jgi:superfamily I DNA and/or RNA helicase
VVLAGDPRQLPPTVTSPEAMSRGLAVTLFERLSSAGLQPLLLDTQYRMHPAISAFPSLLFYGSKLRDGVAAADKPPAQARGARPSVEPPVLRLACTGG